MKTMLQGPVQAGLCPDWSSEARAASHIFIPNTSGDETCYLGTDCQQRSAHYQAGHFYLSTCYLFILVFYLYTYYYRLSLFPCLLSLLFVLLSRLSTFICT